MNKEYTVCIHGEVLEKNQPKKEWNLSIDDTMNEASDHLLSKITPG